MQASGVCFKLIPHHFEQVARYGVVSEDRVSALSGGSVTVAEISLTVQTVVSIFLSFRWSRIKLGRFNPLRSGEQAENRIIVRREGSRRKRKRSGESSRHGG